MNEFVEYQIGDQIRWEGARKTDLGGRLPGDSGIVEGTTFCDNAERFPEGNPPPEEFKQTWEQMARIAQGPDSLTYPPDSGAPQFVPARVKKGCPSWLHINVEIQNNRIVKVYFAEDIRDVAPDRAWW